MHPKSMQALAMTMLSSCGSTGDGKNMRLEDKRPESRSLLCHLLMLMQILNLRMSQFS